MSILDEYRQYLDCVRSARHDLALWMHSLTPAQRNELQIWKLFVQMDDHDQHRVLELLRKSQD